MAPAGLLYCAKKGFFRRIFLVFIIGMLLLALLTQAVTCLLGWLLHFLLAGFRHKAIIATVFLTAVMVLYLYGINQLENLMLLLVTAGKLLLRCTASHGRFMRSQWVALVSM